MRIKCVFCGGWINNPKMDRMICEKKECNREYHRENSIMYRSKPENKKKIREYHQRPEVKRKMGVLSRKYQRALYKLRDNHKEEFIKIHKKLKREKNG